MGWWDKFFRQPPQVNEAESGECQHAWKVVKDQRHYNTQPKFDKMNGYGSDLLKIIEASKDTQHTILQCTKCGKLHETILKV